MMDGPVQINLFAVFVVVAAIATTLLVFAARWFKPPPRKRRTAAPAPKPEADFDLEGSLKKSSDGMANGDRPSPAEQSQSGPVTASPTPAPAAEHPPEDPKATSVFSKRKLGGVIVPPRRTGARSHVPEDAGPDGGPPRSAAPAAGTAAPPPASPAPQPEPQASAPETLAPPEDVAEITAPDTETDFKITDRDSSVFSSPMGGAPVAPFPESQWDDGEAEIEDAPPETVPPTDPAATEAEAPAPEKNDVFGSIFRDIEPPAEPMASDDFVDDTPPESPAEYTDNDLSDFDDDDPEIAAPIVEAHDHAPPEPVACEEEVEAPEPSVFEHAGSEPLAGAPEGSPPDDLAPVESEPEGLPHAEFSDIEHDLPETPPAPEPEAEIDPLDELIVPPAEPEPEEVAFAEPPEVEPEPEPESGPEPAPEPGPASEYVPPILAPQPPPAPKSEPEPAAAAPEPSLTMPPPPSAPINDEPVAAAPTAPPPPDAPILNDGDTDEADDAFENQLSRMRDNGAAPKASTTIPGFPVQAAEPEAEPVDMKAFSPMSVSPREPFIIQAVFHPEGEGQEAVQVASLVDPTASQRASRSLSQLVRPGQTLTATLEVDGAEIDAPVQSLLWEGKTEGLQFLVELPEQFERMSALAKLRILIDGVSVGSTAWRIVVQQGAKSDDPASQSTHVPTQYRKAFVSYSSKDRAEVLKRVQGLQAAGIEVFQDVLDLEPGDRWARELYRHIDESDAFYLFWSPDSAKSEWVAREWRYALDRAMTHPDKRPDICPVILTAPPPAPPQELADKHFNDIIAYVLAAIQQQG